MAIQIEKRKPVSLIGEEPGLNHLIAGLGWDTAVVNGHPVDLDLSVFMLGENGKPVILTMGCYGIGVSRVVAAAIEQNFDERGILWNDTLAPFQIALVPLRYETEVVREATDKLYAELTAAGFEVLLDDRDKKTSPGIKFADMELIGIPHRIVISDRGLADGNLEYKSRRETEAQAIPAADVLAFLQARIRG